MLSKVNENLRSPAKNCVLSLAAGKCCVWGHNQSNLFENKYMWAIDNFSFKEPAVAIAIKSPVFTFSLPDKNVEFIIEAWPKGGKSKNYVSAYVTVTSQGISINAKATLGIINRYGQEKELFKSKPTVLMQDHLLGKADFVSWSDLYDPNSNLCISSDRLIIYCGLSVVVEGVSVRCDNFFRNVVGNTLSEDFEELFENKKFSDFTLMVGGKAIPAHKGILSVRSSVWAAQLTDNTTATMEIENLSYEGVVELLRYIYTGQVGNVDHISQELLLASIKYRLDGLQQMCYENIVSQMNVDNAAFLLIFACENQLKQLKDMALVFFKKHGRAIMETVGFTFLKTEHPHIVLNDLFESFVH